MSGKDISLQKFFTLKREVILMKKSTLGLFIGLAAITASEVSEINLVEATAAAAILFQTKQTF